MADRKKRSKRNAATKLNFDRLEPRQMRAGDIGVAISDDTFLVQGSGEADQMEFIAGPDEHIVRRNGQEQTISASQFTTILFESDHEDDSMTMTGQQGVFERFKSWSDESRMTSDLYTVKARGFKNVAAVANDGDGDRAYLYGTEGDDQLYANPTQSNMTRADGTVIEASDFDRVYIYADEGNDVAVFEDGEGDDVFRVKENYAVLDSDESYIKAFDFLVTQAFANNGGYDKAYQFDTEDSDLLVVSDERVRMISETKDSESVGFERNYSYSKNGGNDYVRVYDSVFDENFSFETIFDDTGINNGFEARRDFLRLFSGSFYRRAEGFLVSDAMEVNPRYLIGEFADTGAVGVNADFENGIQNQYFIELQRYGCELITAGFGIAHQDMVEDGINVIQWGIDQQAADGSFPGSDDAVHSTSLFMEAVGRSIEELDLFNYAGFTTAMRQSWVNSLQAMSSWMIENDDDTANIDLEPFAHRYFLRAAGLKRAAILTGDTSLDVAANQYFQDGYEQMTVDGVLPERGGFDLNYQIVGLKFAGDFYRMSNDSVQHVQIAELFNASLSWITARIDEDGNADLSDSSRSGELARDGSVKKFDYLNAIRAFYSGFEITDNEAWLDLADAIFHHDSSAV